ncbi:MAG TPA: class I SAM-dependent methyltransferase [Pseudolabrys sp.]|nr:class I SAM-dependent methyltransferase [Pseudolabrys sp.]
MGFYGTWLMPRLCHLAMRNKRLRPSRQRVVGAAEGDVLEIGIGSGLNFPYYGPQARRVFALEPSPQLIDMARRAARDARVPAAFLEASAEQIPLDARSVDSIVMTWVGCSIPDVEAALREMRRVLRPGGRLLFVEHGRAADAGVARWQDRLNPYWQRLSGGCHLNRRIIDQMPAAGFRVGQVETGYLPGPKVLTFLYEGTATT